jgi:hypothetical protein
MNSCVLFAYLMPDFGEILFQIRAANAKKSRQQVGFTENSFQWA